MTAYEYISNLAAAYNYPTFTALQECAFRNSAAYDSNKDLFILGETSSGKTLIPLLLYLIALEKAAHKAGVDSTSSLSNTPDRLDAREIPEEYRPKMLFAVPYRALAAQKVKEMRKFFEGWGLKIIQSTGEYRQDDESVKNGKVDIAVVITEKVYKFEARSPSFLSQYDFVVLDEIGLIDNRERGIRLDFLLTWAKFQKNEGKPRVIALGTPFFDWSAYIESYCFTEIKAERHPVPLSETLIEFNNSYVKVTNLNTETTTMTRIVTNKEIADNYKKFGCELKTTCHFLEDELCPVMKECRLNPMLECSHTQEKCIYPVIHIADERKSSKIKTTDILISLCRKQLELGRQVLIFCNNREIIIDYCKILYNSLGYLLPESPSGEECQRQILTDSELEGDDLYGIMEHGEDETGLDFYKMFVSGIAFHSAALPHELRSYVENNFLESRRIKIVCSTETLAFGVNSSVDTVIIADIKKNINGEICTITNDEYRNYLGRAGRLCTKKSAGEIHGYVYTLISYKQKESWNKLRKSADEPKHMRSLLLSEANNKMPFFILNMLPVCETDIVTQEEIVNMLRILPKEESCTESDVQSFVNSSLHALTDYGLIVKTSNLQLTDNDDFIVPVKKVGYCLTAMGKRMRGFIIGRSDYELLIKALSECFIGIFNTPNVTKFLYLLLKTKHAENGLNSVFENNDSMRMNEEDVKSFITKSVNTQPEGAEWLCGITDATGIRILYVLATMIAWSQGKTAKYIYRKFGVHYALILKLAENIAYLIEIAREIIPFYLDKIYTEKKEFYLKIGITSEKLHECLNINEQFIKHFYISIKFGININIYEKLLSYLTSDIVMKSELEASANQLFYDLSPDRINPATARFIKRISARYAFFEKPLQTEFTDSEEKERYFVQLKQYTEDIKNMDELLRGFFLGTRYYKENYKRYSDAAITNS